MTGLVYTSPEATGSWYPSPLIVSRDSFSLWTWSRVQTARSTPYFNGYPYIFDILSHYYIQMYVCVPHCYFWSIKDSSDVVEGLRLRNFQGSQVSSFDFSTLYTSLPSQKRTSVLQIRRDFSPTRHMTRINVGLALSLVKLLLSSWKIYMCNLVTWYTNK